MDLQKYLGLFVSETREHLEEAAEAMALLEQKPGDTDLLNLLFRHGHSIKGMAASMGFQPLAQVSHALEDLFDQVRQGRLELTRELGDQAFKALDALGEAVDRVERREELPAGLDECGATLRALLGQPEPALLAPEPALRAAPPESQPAPAREAQHGPLYNAEIRLSPDVPMPAARALVLFKKLESIAHIHFASPPKDSILRGEFHGALLVQFSSSSSESALRAELEGPAVDSLLLGPAIAAVTDAQAPLPRVSALPPGQAAPASSTIRIRTDILDRFLDHLGELVIHEGRLKCALGPRLPEAGDIALQDLHKTLERLRGDLMGLRMMAFEHIAPRLVRAVRNLGSNLDKEVTLSIEGRDVELDRSILEEIVDPINHMLRNAVDHGIEAPEERTALGKDQVGRITIDNTSEGDWATVEIRDDGRGMDPDRIRQAAVQRQFLSEREAAELDDEEALMLVTIPGFSTASRVTEVSGRGVGMDVVRTRIESLGGRLKIHSTAGRGTRIVLRLPLTVAVIHAFLVHAANQVYAVPVSNVYRTVEVDRHNVQIVDGVPWLVSLGEEKVELRRLDGLMKQNGTPVLPPEQASCPALLFRVEDRPMGLLVDAVLDKRDIIVKPLRSPLENLREYSGATILEDGQIALILDLQNLTA